MGLALWLLLGLTILVPNCDALSRQTRGDDQDVLMLLERQAATIAALQARLQATEAAVQSLTSSLNALNPYANFSGQCPEGWTRYGGKCYLYKHETYNWFGAKSVCETMGAHLVEDTGSDLHQFLIGLIRSASGVAKSTWIGMQDFSEENVWVSGHHGQRMKLDLWDKNEPQDAAGEEDCVGIVGEEWADFNCEDFHWGFICQID